MTTTTTQRSEKQPLIASDQSATDRSARRGETIQGSNLLSNTRRLSSPMAGMWIMS